MRIIFGIALASVVVASPASATGGLSCRPVDGAGPTIDVATGRVLVPAILSVTLREGRKIMTAGPINSEGKHSLVVGQAWYDPQEVRVDLLDVRQARFEGKLRVRFGTGRFGHVALGSFSRRGRTYRVRCLGE